MVFGVISTVQSALKYRGGWRGLLEHMYSNGDYPFKMGTFMGADNWGNRYYENKVDYPAGQHRWVEPSDIHNFDSSQIPPEWQGWMSSVHDCTPSQEEEYFAEKLSRLRVGEISHAPYRTVIGHQEPYFNFHGMHNQSQIRSRGYGIGNNVVGLPPGAPDAYYTQPGSPYNEHSIRKFERKEFEDGSGRTYKNEMWKNRMLTDKEKNAEHEKEAQNTAKEYTTKKLTPREEAIIARGGTIVRK